jgi:hypothetical protein
VTHRQPCIPITPTRTLLAVLALVIVVARPEHSAAQAGPHLRVLDQALKTVLDRGVAQSPTLQKLIAEIETTRILVFAECSMRLPYGVGGRMNFVTNANDYRFVRIAVDCMLGERWQISLLAHELQHALEIGRNPDVADVESMESLYEEIGYPTSREGGVRHYETEDAIIVQRAVEDELAGRGVPGVQIY